MTPTPAEASTFSEIYELLRYQRSTGSRLRRSMTHNLDCFALLSGDESQAGAMSSAIRSEGGVTVSSRWRQWWRCLALPGRGETQPCTVAHRCFGTPSRVPKDKPASMKWISI